MIVSRQANLGDDHIAFPLSPGANVVVFRVNNGTGAWRLLARIRIHRCPGDCSTAAAVRQ
jgi:hypothetical protein